MLAGSVGLVLVSGTVEPGAVVAAGGVVDAPGVGAGLIVLFILAFFIPRRRPKVSDFAGNTPVQGVVVGDSHSFSGPVVKPSVVAPQPAPAPLPQRQQPAPPGQYITPTNGNDDNQQDNTNEEQS